MHSRRLLSCGRCCCSARCSTPGRRSVSRSSSAALPDSLLSISAAVDAVTLGDEVGRAAHASVGQDVEILVASRAGESVKSKDLHGRIARALRVVKEPCQPFAVGVECSKQRVAERLLLAAAGVPVECGRRIECCPGGGDLPAGAEDTAEMDAAERGEPHVPSRLCFCDPERERRFAGVVVACLALGATETRELVGLGLLVAETP